MSQLTTQRRPARLADPMSPDFGWRVQVTAQDVRHAWDAWLTARDGGAPRDRVQDLREELERVWRAEAYQVSAEVSPGAGRS